MKPEQPISDQPISDQPISDQPISEQPISEQPISDQPTSDQPTSEQTKADRAVTLTITAAAADQPNITLQSELTMKLTFEKSVNSDQINALRKVIGMLPVSEYDANGVTVSLVCNSFFYSAVLTRPDNKPESVKDSYWFVTTDQPDQQPFKVDFGETLTPKIIKNGVEQPRFADPRTGLEKLVRACIAKAYPELQTSSSSQSSSSKVSTDLSSAIAAASARGVAADQITAAIIANAGKPMKTVCAALDQIEAVEQTD